MNKDYDLSWDIYPKVVTLQDYPSNDYFCVHILYGPGELTMIHGRYTPGPVLEYSYNKITWIEWTEVNPILITNHVYLRYKSGIWNNSATDTLNFYNSFHCNVPYYVSGKMSSLISNDMSVTNPISAAPYGFKRLFYKESALMEAKYLQFDILNMKVNGTGMYEEMFAQSGLITPPTTLPQSVTQRCYARMFGGCRFMTTAPTLPIIDFKTTINGNDFLAIECYKYMFQYCESLLEPPSLPAIKITSSCYFGMFDGCTSLTKVNSLVNSQYYFSTTQLISNYYVNQFDNMYFGTNITVSDTETGLYTIAWKVPNAQVTWEDQWGNAAVIQNMFGRYQSSKSITSGTTYYISSQPVQ